MGLPPRADRRGGRISRLASDELLGQCAASGWDARRMAERLGIARSTLYQRLRDAGISLRASRKSEGSEIHRNSTGVSENGSDRTS